MYLYPDADQRYRNTGWSESLGTSGTPGTEAATHALGVIQTRPGSRRTQVGVPLSCPRSELSVSDRHPRKFPTDTHAMFTVKALSVDRIKFLRWPPQQIQPPSATVLTSWARSFMTNSKTSEPIEACWRVIEGSTTRMLSCVIFGASCCTVELRIGYFVDVPLHSHAMGDIESARVLAKDWLNVLRAAAAEKKIEVELSV